MAVDRIIRKTSEYLAIPSVVGHERFFMRYLAEDFGKLGFTDDFHDGLLAVHGKKPLSAIISAHIDRHGLISIGDGEYAYAAQYIKEIKYGQQNTASQTELENISKRFEGEEVYVYNPENGERLGEGIITSSDADIESGDAIFNLHDMPPEPIGMPVAYARTAEEIDGHFKGQLDNAISIGTLNVLCQDGFEGTVLLTTEEEIGKSWRHMANWLEKEGIETESLIVIDTSPYKDNESIDSGMVVLRHRDKSEIFNTDLTKAIAARCEALGIPHQFKDEYLLAQGKEIRQLGSTELGKLVAEAKGRWSGATVQIPTVMYHTSNETTSRESIKNYYALLKNILIEERIAAE